MSAPSPVAAERRHPASLADIFMVFDSVDEWLIHDGPALLAQIHQGTPPATLPGLLVPVTRTLLHMVVNFGIRPLPITGFGALWWLADLSQALGLVPVPAELTVRVPGSAPPPPQAALTVALFRMLGVLLDAEGRDEIRAGLLTNVTLLETQMEMAPRQTLVRLQDQRALHLAVLEVVPASHPAGWLPDAASHP